MELAAEKEPSFVITPNCIETMTEERLSEIEEHLAELGPDLDWKCWDGWGEDEEMHAARIGPEEAYSGICGRPHGDINGTRAELEWVARSPDYVLDLLRSWGELHYALEKIAAAIEENEKREYLREPDWNPEAHCEPITLQVKDARRIFDLLEGRYPQPVS